MAETWHGEYLTQEGSDGRVRIFGWMKHQGWAVENFKYNFKNNSRNQLLLKTMVIDLRMDMSISQFLKLKKIDWDQFFHSNGAFAKNTSRFSMGYQKTDLIGNTIPISKA